jgi:hypothetical protein
MIDNFFCHYQYTIQVLIAIGTIGSVITSLILARLQYGIKTKGTISIKIFLPKLGYINPGIRIDGKNIKEENLYMVANIDNIGNVKVKIDGNVFYMKIPFLNLAITKLPFTLEHTLHKFPCWIEPGESKTFTAKYDEKNLSFAIPSLEKILPNVFDIHLSNLPSAHLSIDFRQCYAQSKALTNQIFFPESVIISKCSK